MRTQPAFLTQTSDMARWRGWARAFALSGAGLAAALLAFIIAMDPYGILPSARTSPRPLMDINQRFMYPQVVRSGRFDAAVFGTSTLRLLDPQQLSAATGSRFANLAMNAATPWEQTQIAALFAREVSVPKVVIWGIEAQWCDEDATSDARRLTPRPFPPWLYGTPGLLDTFRLFNFTSLEIAVRLAGYRLGSNRERIRRDGFEVFTPPENTYDPARAALHLYGGQAYGGVGAPRPDLSPVTPAVALTEAQVAAIRFPALDWLEQGLARFPATTARLLVLSPVHAASQPRRGTAAAARDNLCKQRLAELAERQQAALIDYRFHSDLTAADDNFWDPVHYRLPVAARLERTLSEVLVSGRPVTPEPAARMLATWPAGTLR